MSTKSPSLNTSGGSLKTKVKPKDNMARGKIPQKGQQKLQERKRILRNSKDSEILYKQIPKLCNIKSVIDILHTPSCPSSLGIARFLFGLMMVIDIPDERGLSEIDIKYGNPMKCHFPLFDWMNPLPLEYMGILYSIMWLGAAGVCLGYKFQLSCIMFTVPYCSLDSWLNPSIRKKPVPQWNYAILRFQFFILYFYAGVKKFDRDWIGGHSMTRLSLHWVFDPFRYILTNDQIDLWLIHVSGFVFDLTVGFFLLVKWTRPMAIIFSMAFHLMNSRIFHIGQFPYVCLCMTPIFCDYDWPERLWQNIKSFSKKSSSISGCVNSELDKDKKAASINISCHQSLTFYLLLSYVVIQLFLPFSHFITKGYNNWTNGLYGYSWDMMVHNWDSILTVVKVVDNESGEEYFIDPEAWVDNLRFSQHGDMLKQYASCLQRNLPTLSGPESRSASKFKNISVYIDVWCSLNGRFQQRMFDPRQDLTIAEWNPFERIKWLMPLISDLTPWRETITELEDEVYKKSNESGILFVADFPGLHLNNYISTELSNVTITVLQGTVVLEKLGLNQSDDAAENRTMYKGDVDSVRSGEFHTVYTVSSDPSCYMYSFVNETLRNSTDDQLTGTLKGHDSILESLEFRLESLVDSILILRSCFNKFLYNTPIPVRLN